MKKLFLSSSFAEVSALFPEFANEDLQGKRVTFIPTASIPESVKFYVGTGKKALEKLGLIVDELEITTATNEEISKKILKNNYIYVTGGNTFFLLQELKRTGADNVITVQINSGKIYIGESAGSMILSPDIEYVQEMDDRRKAKELNDNLALSVIKFYPLPHHTNFPFKKAVEKIIAKYESELKLVPISNSQVITVKGNRMKIKEKTL
jgi:dipeptidase E